ncbi:hypothetical protein R1flu_014212 [Riccia fluitans]|uniref:Uncharacterized protein n=1 Tax=Riccia fluitans TaxID=41844 RepID=A0ABD1YFT3_9MARC
MLRQDGGLRYCRDVDRSAILLVPELVTRGLVCLWSAYANRSYRSAGRAEQLTPVFEGSRMVALCCIDCDTASQMASYGYAESPDTCSDTMMDTK